MLLANLRMELDELLDRFTGHLSNDEKATVLKHQLAKVAPAPDDQAAQAAVEGGEPLPAQVTRLADFIIGAFPGEPSQSQGAIDTAIRLLGRLTGEGLTEAEYKTALLIRAGTLVAVHAEYFGHLQGQSPQAPDEALVQMKKLDDFICDHFPAEMRAEPTEPQSVVDTAIQLLEELQGYRSGELRQPAQDPVPQPVVVDPQPQPVAAAAAAAAAASEAATVTETPVAEQPAAAPVADATTTEAPVPQPTV